MLIDASPDALTLMERLSAYVSEYGDGPEEVGERTKLIVPPEQIILVRETPSEIRALAKARYCQV